jgi:hypothetical protein
MLSLFLSHIHFYVIPFCIPTTLQCFFIYYFLQFK